MKRSTSALNLERFDPIAAVEAAYRIDRGAEDWLAAITDCVAPALDGGMGCAAYAFRFDAGKLRLFNFVDRGAPVGWQHAATAAVDSGAEMVLSLYRSGGGCHTVVERVGHGIWDAPIYREAVEPLGLVDFVAMNASDAEGGGILLGAAHGGEIIIRPDERDLLARVCAHVAAANRLRARAESGELGEDAVCDLAGAIVHAEPAAQPDECRTALRAAAIAIDRCRRRKRKSDPTDPITEWKALVREEWSLVDRFESDGRHYLVAKRNAPRSAAPAALTEGERRVLAFAALGHSNKLIAYDLGLEENAVAQRLRRAARKLGARSRVELVQRYLAELEKR